MWRTGFGCLRIGSSGGLLWTLGSITKAGYFLTSWVTISFSNNILHHGVSKYCCGRLVSYHNPQDLDFNTCNDYYVHVRRKTIFVQTTSTFWVVSRLSTSKQWILFQMLGRSSYQSRKEPWPASESLSCRLCPVSGMGTAASFSVSWGEFQSCVSVSVVFLLFSLVTQPSQHFAPSWKSPFCVVHCPFTPIIFLVHSLQILRQGNWTMSQLIQGAFSLSHWICSLHFFG
jgi:hypothetical protein